MSEGSSEVMPALVGRSLSEAPEADHKDHLAPVLCLPDGSGQWEGSAGSRRARGE